ncbi:MAG: DUF1508 domain-containing protein [Acidobacteriota bacterium]
MRVGIAKAEKYEVYPDNGQWRWRLVGANGKNVASGEAYYHKSDCLGAIALLKASLGARIIELVAGQPVPELIRPVKKW